MKHATFESYLITIVSHLMWKVIRQRSEWTADSGKGDSCLGILSLNNVRDQGSPSGLAEILPFFF